METRKSNISAWTDVELPNGQVTRRHISNIRIKTNHGDQSNKEDETDDNALPDIQTMLLHKILETTT